MTSNSKELKQYESFAKDLAKKAGDLIMEKWKEVKFDHAKYKKDLVTNLDMEAENLIVSAIEKEYPDHNILTEERPFIDKKSEYTWVIDPIDGTRNFYKFLPIFGISIALKKGSEYVVGVINAPKVGSLFHAIKGGGAFENGKPISISSEKKLEDAYLTVEFPTHRMDEEQFNWAIEKFGELGKKSQRMRSLGAATLALSYTARGSFDAYIDLSSTTKEWDYAAGKVILEEAGGEYRQFPNGAGIAASKDILEQITKVFGL